MSEGPDVFECTSAFIALLDREGRVVRANTALSRKSGARVGASFTDALAASDRTRVAATLTRLEAGAEATFQAHLDGASTSVHFSATRAKADGGIEIVGVAAPADVAARLALLENVIYSAPVILFELDAKGNYISCDGKAMRDMGADPGSLVGLNCLEMMAGTDAETNVRRALAGETFGARIKLPNPTPPHEMLYFDAWYVPTRDDAGAITGMIGFSFDAGEQQKAEAALREQLAVTERQNQTLDMFGRVLESAPLILWSMDREGNSTGARGKGLELLGGMLDGPPMNTLDMFKDQPEILEPIIRALAGEEVRTTTAPAPGVYFENWYMPVWRGEEVDGVMGLAIDATERVRNEVELREKLQLIERQSATIRALATPIIQVWDEVLCLPVIGTVDSARTAEMMQALLESIVREQARYAIVDLTGVEVVDTSTADHLIQLFRAARVLGVDGILCGIRPAVAQTVVALGLELGSVKTMRSLRDALKWCIRARSDERATRGLHGGDAPRAAGRSRGSAGTP